MNDPAAATHRARLSTRLGFFIAGAALAAWAPLAPYAKLRLGIGDGAFGLLLLSLGLGSIIAMPLAGALVGRLGCRTMLVGAALLACAMLPLLAVLADAASFAAALFLFGAGIGVIDCVINIQAVIVEQASRRPLMSGFHGLFSVGGIAGAGGVSGLLSLGLTPLAALLVALAVILACLLWAAPHFLRTGATRDAPLFALPRGGVLALGLLCFIVFLTEGAILDWSAIFLTASLSVDPARAGFGYAAFSATMTLGRFTGDWAVARLGAGRVVGAGALAAASGLALAAAAPSFGLALAGFALVGAGCANIVPVLFSAAGRQRAMPGNLAVAAVTTLGYAGILAGPAGIGLIAGAVSLSGALLLVAALMLVVAASGRRLPGA